MAEDTGDKAALRRSVRRARAARSRADQERDAVGLRDVLLSCPAVLDAGRVATYWSLPGEPGTGPLTAALQARGVEVLLPVVREAVLDWAVDDGRYVDGAYGLREPAGPRLGSAALADCDVVLVPALAVDRSGSRLGQGAGFYDRALCADRPRLVVALVHDDELLPAGSIPTEPHDRPVDVVVTPIRWVDLR